MRVITHGIDIVCGQEPIKPSSIESHESGKYLRRCERHRITNEKQKENDVPDSLPPVLLQDPGLSQ